MLSSSSAAAAAQGVGLPWGHVLEDENYSTSYDGFSSPLTPWCSERVQLTESNHIDLKKGKPHKLNR